MILDILLIIASYLALFFSVMLFLKKNKHVSDYYLAIWLLILSVYQLLLVFLPKYGTPFSLIHSVFLFLYIKSITSKSGSDIKNLLYFLPSLLFFVPYFFIPSFSSMTIFRLSQLLIPIAFILGSYFQLHRYHIYIKRNYADIEYADINWLYLLFGGDLFFYAISVFAGFSEAVPKIAIYAVTLFLFMNFTGLKAIRQQWIFIKRPGGHNENTENTDNSTYANYGLKETEAKTLSQKLRHYMESEKPYLSQELNLNDLSKALDVYPHYITQILNTVFNQNFYDYVNTYRVEEAKKQLKDPKKSNLTILAIAFDCGFNSKTAFNRAFKQKTSRTPSEFRSADN